MNADETTLCVAVELNGKTPHVYFFDIRSFAVRGETVKPFTQIPTRTSPGVFVTELCFNPVLPSMASAVFSDGSMALFMINSEDPSREPDCATLPPAEAITCISWSPKGKQLVAGKRDGSLTQYKPDLKEAKTMPAPPGSSLCAVSIVWISTYQFAVALKDTKDPYSRPGQFLQFLFHSH